MAAVCIYSFKVSMCLGVLYGFYYLVLRNNTFFNWNRWYLLMGSIVCVLIPGIASLSWLDSQQVHNLPVLKVISNWYSLSATGPLKSANPGFYFDFFNFWLPLVFFLGMLIQSCRLGVQFWSFYRLLQHANRLPHYTGKVYQVNQNIAPFSFGKSIFLNINLLQPPELPEIIRHEMVHINQKHTLDIIWLEFLILFQWYNPFAYLLKRAVRQNLEFIADRSVLVNPGTDKKTYQYLLLRVIDLPTPTIVHQFAFSPLKTRIKMMNQLPSKQQELAKFLLVLPLMAVLLLACQDTITETTLKELADAKLVAPPPPPPVPELPPPPPVVTPSTAEHKALIKRNSQIEVVGWQGENTMVIFLKSGEREEYDLNQPSKKAEAEKKYGKLPQKPVLKQ